MHRIEPLPLVTPTALTPPLPQAGPVPDAALDRMVLKRRAGSERAGLGGAAGFDHALVRAQAQARGSPPAATPAKALSFPGYALLQPGCSLQPMAKPPP